MPFRALGTPEDPVRHTLIPALLTAIIGSLALAGPASADTAEYKDPSRDVMVLTLSDQTDSEDPPYEHTSTPNGDIILSRFTHDRDAVTLYVRYREIYVPHFVMGWQFDIVGSNRRERFVDLTATSRTVGGRASMVGGRCKVASRINYRTNAIKVKFPRRCLGNPGSFRVASVTYTITARDDSAFVYYDDPMRRAGSPDQIGTTGTRWISAA